jgi:hypothetical protein
MRRLLRWLLFQNWRASLPYGERVRLDHWGATGNPKHHPFSWAE